ncbi:YebC/PmpR family DNA-binding transcriptional regulator, partial [Arthrospira platensis SPKY1]|nr:YebC/PmpR family DNA-binding transcriptional regulator [Arthrospira platensis SPKY1]
GADDVANEGDHYEVTCPIADYDAVSQAFNDKGLELESAELVYLPNVTVPIADKEIAAKILRLIEKLDELEDVKAVHSNLEIDPAIENDLDG